MGVVSSSIEEAVELAEECGLFLDDWQRWCLEWILSERADGSWAASQVLLLLPRQNGKNAVLEALELAALYMFGERRIIHTAHLARTAADHMERMKALVRANPELDAITRFYEANGKERMVRTDTGARIEFITRGQKTMRGGSPSRVIFDEALYLTDPQIQAIIPSLSAQSMNDDGPPQMIFASSAPLADSVVLHRVRGVAFGDGEFDRIFAAEWGIELPEGGFDELNIGDRDLWAAANPGLNIRISEEWIVDNELAILSPEAFAIERLGVVFPIDVDARTVKIPAAEWSATIEHDPDARPALQPGEVTVTWAVETDGRWSSLGIAAGSLTEPYGELIDHREGTAWLPTRIVEVVKRWQPVKLGCNGAGATGAQVGPILAALRAAGLTIEIEQLGATEWARACQGFLQDVISGALTRPPDQDPLDLAAETAGERRVGQGWAWAANDVNVPICPLEALTGARALLPTEQPRSHEPLIAYTR